MMLGSADMLAALRWRGRAQPWAIAAFTACGRLVLADRDSGQPLDHLARRSAATLSISARRRRPRRGCGLGRLDLGPDLLVGRAHPSSVALALACLAAWATFSASARLSSIRAR
jgi:hypothetical protein